MKIKNMVNQVLRLPNGIAVLGLARLSVSRSVAQSCTGHFCRSVNEMPGTTEAEIRASGVKQDNGDGEYETNNFDGNFPGGCGSCRGHGCLRLDCAATIGAGGAFICVGSGTQAHGGICWALAVQ
jgi:hypothetical protein